MQTQSVTYHAQYLPLFRVRLLKTKVFSHHRVHVVHFRNVFLPCSTVFLYTFFQNTHWQYALAIRTGNTHWRGWKRKLSGVGGAECTGGDGMVCCIYHTRHGVRQNDHFITIILFSWSREAKIEIEIQLITQPYCESHQHISQNKTKKMRIKKRQWRKQ